MNRNYQGPGGFHYQGGQDTYYYQQDYHSGFVAQSGDHYYQNDFYNPGFQQYPGYTPHPGYENFANHGYGLAYYGDNVQNVHQGSFGPNPVHNGNQGQGNTSSQSSASGSKYSYSQNRFKGRQNRQQNRADATATLEPSTVSAELPAEKQEFKDGNENPLGRTGNNTPSQNHVTGAQQNQRDAGQYRRGRFQGSDSRTKAYNHNQQMNERKQNYNRNYSTVRSNDNKAEAVNEDKDKIKSSVHADSAENINTNVKDVKTETTNSKTGAKGKSYKDVRKGVGRFDSGKKPGHRQDRRGDSTNTGASSEPSRATRPTQADRKPLDSRKGGELEQENQPIAENKDVDKNANASSDPSDVTKGNVTGARKKRREIQIYNSRGSMDNREFGHGRNSSYSPREMCDRYNYRGQDYNKRHKDTTSERHGSQTKLSSTPTDEMKGLDLEDDDGEDKTKQYIPPNGLKRATRAKPKGKVNENQRDVLIEQLTRGTYECMVCCEAVRATNAVWSCASCYHMFHLRCIKRWARSPNSIVAGSDKDGWRCPACQNLSFKFPNQYRCFCGKIRDPDVTRTETPHSCGDVCQKSRGVDCRHPCNILCHPGPCPECSASITKSCDCGKSKLVTVCGQSAVAKCDSVCERLLNCGQHFCKDKCHAGPCQKCEVVIKQECYSRHETREVICGSEQSFKESYSCTLICAQTLDCGKHKCERVCHLGPCHSCPMLPGNLTHCPCGAVSLQDLAAEPRTNCLDSVPTCDGVCNKLLKCGPEVSRHQCKQQCHEGVCGPCEGSSRVSCRCDCIEKEIDCSEIAQLTEGNGQFLCDRRCNKKKQCGRHKCGQLCCVLTEHKCDQVCGRKLPCGLHKCLEPCHRGNCPPCLMAGFDELTCHCGAEVLFPPIPCGTLPPECHRACTREHACDHPVRHNCHSDEHCTPCTELTRKMCMGNHVWRSNIPCHLSDISCGMKCSKPLPCGEHSCDKTCHKGACTEDEKQCSQPCQRKREHCDHVCGAPCHGETPCPLLACKATVQVHCACGHREASSTCSIGSVTTDTQEFQRVTLQSLRESLQGSMGTSTVNISKFNQAQIGQGRILECNEECAVLERNKRMAMALQIQNPDLTSKLGSPVFSDFLKEYAKKDATFVSGIDKALSDLVQSAKTSKRASRSHPFPSMNQTQRRVVHELAEHYGCQTQSYDFEPKKNVVATAAKDKCWVPAVSLTSLVQREIHPRAPPPIPHVHKEETLRLTNLATKQSTSLVGEATGGAKGSSQPLSEGWQVIGKKSTKKVSSGPQKSAIATIDKFETNLDNVCTSGAIDYSSLSSESKEALKSEPVVDYFDFTVN